MLWSGAYVWLEWCMLLAGVDDVFHYLDVYVILGPQELLVCIRFWDIMERVCNRLGVRVAPGKKEPSRRITFLRIVIDTLLREHSLPQENNDRLLTSVSH